MKYNMNYKKLRAITAEGLNFKAEGFKLERLYTCKAFYYMFTYNQREFVGLMSYASIVAVYSVSTATVYKFGYFSATTTQHVAKFARFMSGKYKADVSIVPLYVHSRMPAQAARDAIACDFADQIYEYAPLVDSFNMLMLTFRKGGGTFELDGTPANINGGYMVGGFSKCYTMPYTGTKTSVCEYRFVDHLTDLIEELPVNLEGLYIGTWVDNGLLYLELSRQFETLAVAIQAGKVRGQQAIYDIKNKVDIKL